MTDLERARTLIDDFALVVLPKSDFAQLIAAAERGGAAAMREQAEAALAPIADEEMPEPYWDNARARRMDWACAVGRCLNRVRALPLTRRSRHD